VRLFDGVDAERLSLDLVGAEDSPQTTHLRYAVRLR
jgi:hypothetical protein